VARLPTKESGVAYFCCRVSPYMQGYWLLNSLVHVKRSASLNRRFEFHKRRQLFIRTHNETPSVAAMRVSNPYHGVAVACFPKRCTREGRSVLQTATVTPFLYLTLHG
jgi:hypothetical protein